MALDVIPGHDANKYKYHVSSTNFHGKMDKDLDEFDFTYGLTPEKAILTIPQDLDFSRLERVEIANVAASGHRNIFASSGYYFQCIVAVDDRIITTQHTVTTPSGNIETEKISYFGENSIGISTGIYHYSYTEHTSLPVLPAQYRYSPWKFGNLLTLWINKIIQDNVWGEDIIGDIRFIFQDGVFTIRNSTNLLSIYLVSSAASFTDVAPPGSSYVDTMYRLQDIENPTYLPIKNTTTSWRFPPTNGEFSVQSGLQIAMGLIQPLGAASNAETTYEKELIIDAHIITLPGREVSGRAAVRFKNNGVALIKLVKRDKTDRGYIHESFDFIENEFITKGHLVLYPKPLLGPQPPTLPPCPGAVPYVITDPTYIDLTNSLPPTNIQEVVDLIWEQLEPLLAEIINPFTVPSSLKIVGNFVVLDFDYEFTDHDFRYYLVAKCVPDLYYEAYPSDYNPFQVIGWWNPSGGNSRFVNCGNDRHLTTGGYPMSHWSFPPNNKYFIRSLLVSSFLRSSRVILGLNESDPTLADNDSLLTTNDLRDRDRLFSSYLYEVNLIESNRTENRDYFDKHVEVYFARRGKSLSSVATNRLGNKKRIEFELIGPNGIDHAHTYGLGLELDVTFILR